MLLSLRKHFFPPRTANRTLKSGAPHNSRVLFQLPMFLFLVSIITVYFLCKLPDAALHGVTVRMQHHSNPKTSTCCPPETGHGTSKRSSSDNNSKDHDLRQGKQFPSTSKIKVRTRFSTFAKTPQNLYNSAPTIISDKILWHHAVFNSPISMLFVSYSRMLLWKIMTTVNCNNFCNLYNLNFVLQPDAHHSQRMQWHHAGFDFPISKLPASDLCMRDGKTTTAVNFYNLLNLYNLYNSHEFCKLCNIHNTHDNFAELSNWVQRLNAQHIQLSERHYVTFDSQRWQQSIFCSRMQDWRITSATNFYNLYNLYN